MSQFWKKCKNEKPSDSRTVYVIIKECFFIAFCENGKFYEVSQRDEKRKRELKGAVEFGSWIDKPE